jgi:pyruvate carboxylase subunit B
VKYAVEVAGRTIEVEIDGARILVDGRAVDARLAGASGGAIRRLVRGKVSRAILAAPGEGRGAWSLDLAGCRLSAQVLDPRDLAVRRAGAREGKETAGGALRAPMPGLVVRVLVAEGAQVEAGQGLVVLEAMKMENLLKAAGAATVRWIHVSAGARVEKGAVLLELA